MEEPVYIVTTNLMFYESMIVVWARDDHPNQGTNKKALM